jgi:hypothetical protein
LKNPGTSIHENDDIAITRQTAGTPAFAVSNPRDIEKKYSTFSVILSNRKIGALRLEIKA